MKAKSNNSVKGKHLLIAVDHSESSKRPVRSNVSRQRRSSAVVAGWSSFPSTTRLGRVADIGKTLLSSVLYRYFFLPGPRDGFGGGGMVRKRYHCCAIPTILLVSIYNAKPLCDRANMTPKISGVMAIILACAGSMPGVGVIFCMKYIEAAITTGRM